MCSRDARIGILVGVPREALPRMWLGFERCFYCAGVPERPSTISTVSLWNEPGIDAIVESRVTDAEQRQEVPSAQPAGFIKVDSGDRQRLAVAPLNAAGDL
jgi:hypothetical protein